MPTPKPLCINIKSKKFPKERCSYNATRGEYCSRHYKNPVIFTVPFVTRSIQSCIVKIQRFWRLRSGLRLAKDLTPAFFVRSLCHNDSELASFEPLDTVSRDYFFAIRESKRIWGFDIRTLIVQYEDTGRLENPYTKELCDQGTVKAFRDRVEKLRRWKKSLHYSQTSDLTQKQSWNLRVLDMCLRLDMLGYRISTHWFADLDIKQHKELYHSLFDLWNQESISDTLRGTIVPGFSVADKALFKWSPSRVKMKTELDSVRRTNLNVMERLISSASEQSDKTLGAMYVVSSLCQISYRCRMAYPWLYQED
jgi:hypothetical protein